MLFILNFGSCIDEIARLSVKGYCDAVIHWVSGEEVSVVFDGKDVIVGSWCSIILDVDLGW